MADIATVCPVCGATTLTTVKKEHKVVEPYALPREIEVELQHCETCGSEGDFYSSADSLISSAIEASRCESVRTIISTLENEYSMASIERALELPQRTLVKWKSGATKPSASAVTLLRLIGTFPWLMDVADHAYDYDSAQKIHISNAMTSLLSATEFHRNQVRSAGVFTSSDGFVAYVQFTADDGTEQAVEVNEPFAVTEETNRMIHYVEE